jgi:hypothetical protein
MERDRGLGDRADPRWLAGFLHPVERFQRDRELFRRPASRI